MIWRISNRPCPKMLPTRTQQTFRNSRTRLVQGKENVVPDFHLFVPCQKPSLRSSVHHEQQVELHKEVFERTTGATTECFWVGGPFPFRRENEHPCRPQISEFLIAAGKDSRQINSIAAGEHVCKKRISFWSPKLSLKQHPSNTHRRHLHKSPKEDHLVAW